MKNSLGARKQDFPVGRHPLKENPNPAKYLREMFNVGMEMWDSPSVLADLQSATTMDMWIIDAVGRGKPWFGGESLIGRKLVERKSGGGY